MCVTGFNFVTLTVLEKSVTKNFSYALGPDYFCFVFFFFFFFLIWVLWPFQEYFTYVELIIHQRWAKTEEPEEKPPDHP